MLQKSETRACARVSRKSCGGSFRDFPNSSGIPAQLLIAAFAFGGGVDHG